MLLLSIYISIAIGISFICSVLEAVLLSISPSYIAQLKQQGHPASAQLEKLKADIDRPLASILTLNTIAHTIGAATAGAQAAVVFGSEALGIFSAVLTLAILVLSEIVPKTIGATYWRQLAPSAAVSLRWMVWALTPFVWFSEQITKRLARNHEAPKMRDELSAMVHSGERERRVRRRRIKDPEQPTGHSRRASNTSHDTASGRIPRRRNHDHQRLPREA